MSTNRHTIQELPLVSGARLLHVMVPNLSLSAVSVWFRAGSRLDPVGKEGLAHFFEHVLMIKTEKFPDRISRLRALESKGIFYNAYTNKESAYYYGIQLPEHTMYSLELLIDGMMNSRITEEDVIREREVIVNEESENRNNPSRYIWQLGDEGLWPGSSLGKSVLGSSKSIRSITLDDIVGFQQEYYQPYNAVFVVISSDDPGTVRDEINRMLSEGSTQDKVSFIDKEAFSPLKERIVDSRDIDQATVSFNVRTASREECNSVALELIREYFANNWTSRLNTILRVEKGMTYWVTGESTELSDTGSLRFTYSVDPKNMEDAIAITFQELQRFQEDLLSVDLMKEYAEMLISNTARRIITPEDLLYWYGSDAVIGNTVMSPSEYREYVHTLSPSDIQQAAQQFLGKENVSLAIIGPMGE